MITEDPLYQLSINYYRVFVNVFLRRRGKIKCYLYIRFFKKGILEMKRDQVLYPDANGSLRVSYGTVRGCEPDGLSYRYYTTMDGMYDKYLNDPDHLEYFIP